MRLDRKKIVYILFLIIVPVIFLWGNGDDRFIKGSTDDTVNSDAAYMSATLIALQPVKAKDIHISAQSESEPDCENCLLPFDEARQLGIDISIEDVLPDDLESYWENPPKMGEVYDTKPIRIAVEPGHGGYYSTTRYDNTGAASAIDSSYSEKEWSLAVCQYIKDELLNRGYDVYLVRTTNLLKEYRYTSADRARAINGMECDGVIMLHWDSAENEELNGFHVIYKSKRDVSLKLAEILHDKYKETVEGHIAACSSYRNRSTGKSVVARSDIWELNEIAEDIPAVLLESGFASNINDVTWLSDEENFATIAKAIADAFDEYFGKQ